MALFLRCDAVDFPHLPRERLACPDPERRAAFIAAVRRGDIVWHAFPFDAQPEVYSSTLFEWGLNFTKTLDRSLGLVRNGSKVLSLRDVPGLTRSAVPVLAKAGTLGVSVGVNTNSAPPAVPGVKATAAGAAGGAFRWRDPATQTEVIATWHAGGYAGHGGQNIYAKTEAGNCVVVPGLDEALCHSWMGDNSGPPPGRGQIPLDVEQGVEVVRAHWAAFRAMFPAAAVHAAGFDAFWQLLDANRDRLPVFTGEVGDTWIYGISSDPWKLAGFRAMQRDWLRCAEARADAPGCGLPPQQLDRVAEYLLLAGKHTWGKGCAAAGLDHGWDNIAFARLRRTENRSNDASFASCERGWAEQRMQLAMAAAAAAGSPLGRDINASIAALSPRPPSVVEFDALPVPVGKQMSPPLRIGSDGLEIALASTGAIVLLRNTRTGEAYATTVNQLAELWYSTGSLAQEKAYNRNYSVTFPDPWGGPGLGVRAGLNASSELHTWAPALAGLWHNQSRGVVAKLAMPAETVQKYGAPPELWLEVAPSGAPGGVVDLTLSALRKQPTRLPEAMWLGFNPPHHPDQAWQLDKMGGAVRFNETVLNGSKHLHGIASGVALVDNRGGVPGRGVAQTASVQRLGDLRIDSLDAALVAPRLQATIPLFEPDAPDASGGVAFNLWNNGWLCNYIMWYPFALEPLFAIQGQRSPEFERPVTLPVYRWTIRRAAAASPAR